MKYRDLVRFEPIESVIQLEEANAEDVARQLVETFVISERMAEHLTDLVIPNLQIDKPADNKGILVVGNYGTGKSHLLSLISAVAEHLDLLKSVKNRAVAKAASSIAGRFKVVRLEIGATKKSLQQIICGKIEEFLADLGLEFSFPSPNEVTRYKDPLIDMMGKFNGKFPNDGILLVVDELLDYLRSRNEQELILDLGFLREIGEVCKNVRFRCIAGLQETLFDNPKFQFVAESVRRVKDRFEQLRIVRQDVAYVVSERLLSKTDKQRGRVRDHLQQFTPLYGAMAERLEDFVSLFPVHPTYLEVFERIYVAEKRQILKTLSAEIKQLLDQEVPQEEPGLISYDSYWLHLQENPSIRAIPEVREVMDKSKVVVSRIEQAFTKPVYRPAALRIVHGLSVHRLTTDDIYARIGPTVEELRDGLCLYLPLPEADSDFLRTTVENCLKEITKTMSGQYLAYNSENGQYYLDLKKDIDYDAKIQDKAEILSENQLDRYYFDALIRVLELIDQSPYVAGYKIWQHEVEWREHKVTRIGYLFFGAPNERSTAQPPRDYYIYFLQPFEPPFFEDHQLSEEVFFKLTNKDETFLETLRLYAGAREMSLSASSGTKRIYEEKATGYLRKLVAWLRENMLTAFEVIHQGVSKKMIEWLKGHRTGDAGVRDLVNLTGSVCLASCFSDRYPDYPTFTSNISTVNLSQTVQDAARWIAGGAKNNVAITILDGLELLDDDKLKPEKSRYAKAILQKLSKKPANQVLNRKEILTTQNDLEIEPQYKLEPELVCMILLAMAQGGHLTLSVTGKKLDAANVGDAARIPVDQLLGFKHVERPKDLPLAELVALFDVLGISEGLIKNPATRDDAVVQLQRRTREVTEQVVTAKQLVQSGLSCWGDKLLPSQEQEQYRANLDSLQSFLEKLQAFNTQGKLKNFSHTTEDIQDQSKNLSLVKQVEELNALVQELNVLTSYLSEASAVLADEDPCRKSLEQVRQQWRSQLLDPEARKASGFRQKINQALQKAGDEYRTHYLKLHQKARLNSKEDDKKKELMKDSRMEKLNKLAHVSLLPHANLTDLKDRLIKLQTCFALIKDNLESSATCPHCGFRPVESERSLGASGMQVLEEVDQQMDDLVTQWTSALLENLNDPTAQESLNLLPAKQKKAVSQLLQDKELPDKVDNDFVQAIQSALSGLTAIPVTPQELTEALGGGTPCTVEQFEHRFEKFLEKTLVGKDRAKVRLVVKKDEGE